MDIQDVVIIGAGPAGIAAAIQLKRFGINPLIIEKQDIGGLLKNAHLVENYPGFPSGISGNDLINLFKKQIKDNNINILEDLVTDLNYLDNLFIIHTTKIQIYSKFLIIASGTNPKTIDLDIPENIKEKIFYNIYSLQNIYNKEIAIIGGGDAAFDYALNLSNNNKIFLLNRNSTIKCNYALYQKFSNTKNIKYFDNHELKVVTGYQNDKILLTLFNKNDDTIKNIQVDHLIAAIGRTPNMDFVNKKFKEKIRLLEKENLLYMIGDVKNDIYRQIAICVGDGIKSAMMIHQKLKS